MNMPGFTASASLYNGGGRYRARSGGAGVGQASAVVPQLMRQMDLLLCLQNCSLSGSDPACTDTCYRQEHIRGSDDFGSRGDSGGGISEPPELFCGRCINGRQRCAVPGVGATTAACAD